MSAAGFRLSLLFLIASLGRAAAGDSPAADAPKTSPAPERARLGAAAQRNENVAVHQIDNYALKEANIRVGTRTTLVPLLPVEAGAYAAEHGQPPQTLGSLPLLGSFHTANSQPAAKTAPPAPVPFLSAWHGEAWYTHQNSVMNTRAFFQAGPVQPSHHNHYGVSGSGRLGSSGFLTLGGAQRAVRGMVNGNVLVPLAGERTPLWRQIPRRDNWWRDSSPPIRRACRIARTSTFAR